MDDSDTLLDFVFALEEEHNLYPEDQDYDSKSHQLLQNQSHLARYDGFRFFEEIDDPTSPRLYKRPYVITPSRRKLDVPKILRRLRKLESGNPHQVEAIKALEYIRINQCLNNFRIYEDSSMF